MPSNRTALTVPSLLMPAAILPVAAGFWGDHRDEITAVATILVAVALAMLIDRALVRRGAKLASVVSGREISAVTDTRLRMLRRLVFVAILVIGIALALMQVTVVKQTDEGVIASSAGYAPYDGVTRRH